MTYKDFTEKLNAKRDELIQAELEYNQDLIDCIKKEINLLLDSYLGERIK